MKNIWEVDEIEEFISDMSCRADNDYGYHKYDHERGLIRFINIFNK